MKIRFVKKQPLYLMGNRYGSLWTMLVLAVLFAMLLSGCGEKKPKLYRVGILNGSKPFSRVVEGFKAKMTELGYLEGENIIYDLHEANVGSDEERQVLEQFVADEVDT